MGDPLQCPTLANDGLLNIPPGRRAEGGTRLKIAKGWDAKALPRPTLSVVTVVRNGEKTLERTIRSVVGQTFPDIEHIIVDGLSTDGTLDILRQYSDRLAYWVSESDRGIYDAMNKGVALSTGTWIHLLNADDWYADDGVLAKVVPRLELERTNYCPILLQAPDGKRRLHTFHYRRWKLNVNAGIMHPGLIMARTQYNVLGLYDTRYRFAADHDFTLRAVTRYPPLAHETPLVVMPQTGESAQSLWAALLDFVRVTREHGFPAWLGYLLAAGKYILWRSPQGFRRGLRKLWSPSNTYR